MNQMTHGSPKFAFGRTSEEKLPWIASQRQRTMMRIIGRETKKTPPSGGSQLVLETIISRMSIVVWHGKMKKVFESSILRTFAWSSHEFSVLWW